MVPQHFCSLENGKNAKNSGLAEQEKGEYVQPPMVNFDKFRSLVGRSRGDDSKAQASPSDAAATPEDATPETVLHEFHEATGGLLEAQVQTFQALQDIAIGVLGDERKRKSTLTQMGRDVVKFVVDRAERIDTASGFAVSGSVSHYLEASGEVRELLSSPRRTSSSGKKTTVHSTETSEASNEELHHISEDPALFLAFKIINHGLKWHSNQTREDRQALGEVLHIEQKHFEGSLEVPEDILWDKDEQKNASERIKPVELTEAIDALLDTDESYVPEEAKEVLMRIFDVEVMSFTEAEESTSYDGPYETQEEDAIEKGGAIEDEEEDRDLDVEKNSIVLPPELEEEWVQNEALILIAQKSPLGAVENTTPKDERQSAIEEKANVLLEKFCEDIPRRSDEGGRSIKDHAPNLIQCAAYLSILGREIKELVNAADMSSSQLVPMRREFAGPKKRLTANEQLELAYLQLDNEVHVATKEERDGKFILEPAKQKILRMVYLQRVASGGLQGVASQFLKRKGINPMSLRSTWHKKFGIQSEPVIDMEELNTLLSAAKDVKDELGEETGHEVRTSPSPAPQTVNYEQDVQPTPEPVVSVEHVEQVVQEEVPSPNAPPQAAPPHQKAQQEGLTVQPEVVSPQSDYHVPHDQSPLIRITEEGGRALSDLGRALLQRDRELHSQIIQSSQQLIEMTKLVMQQSQAAVQAAQNSPVVPQAPKPESQKE